MTHNRLATLRGTLGIAIAVALLGTVLAVTPASAFLIASESGLTGDHGWSPPDEEPTPAGRCGYSAENSNGFAFLRWIKLRAPNIAARDVTGARDSQKASWQVVVQRKIGTGPWRKVAASSRQTRTTWDDQSADYDPIKVSVNGQANQVFRAIVYLRWMRGGSVEGTMKLVTEFYGVKWTVGSPDYVYTDWCDGRAD